MNRRDFLQLLGLGAVAVAAPAIVLPERRIWQVSRNAPVGSALDRAYARVDYGHVERGALVVGEYDEDGVLRVREAGLEPGEIALAQEWTCNVNPEVTFSNMLAAPAPGEVERLRAFLKGRFDGLSGTLVLPEGANLQWLPGRRS
jgi:hypothetical protein